MKLRRLIVALAAALMLTGLSQAARADVISFSHTWTGTESLSGPDRLNRNAVASVAGTAKPFPGTGTAVSTFFQTFSVSALPGTVVLVTPTSQTTRTFLALYDSTFNPASLSTNYLGDQGASLVTAFFSVNAPASGTVLLVASTVSDPGTADIGASFSADVTFTPSAIPEPSALALAGAVFAGVGALRRARRKS